MKRLFPLGILLLVAATLAGCAHPITMNADLAKLEATAEAPIAKSVGYYLPDALRAVEVTTPGGGGDKVRYFPYRDLEPGFYKALSLAFTSVTKLAQPMEAGPKGVQLVITPEIRTTSASDGAFTWPPTEFTVTLTCAVHDPAGKPVKTLSVTGDGRATFSEFKSNFSLAAVRASDDALAKLVKALRSDPDLRR
ncbi:MAG: hypothetical protein J0H69_14395 [Burkholderiales bacterium]|nr:hypothetical protein [Burkholderiales bacterium]